jgi:UDP-N-acetylmuramate--alanine ligase
MAGSGMAGLAYVAHKSGMSVSGSDLRESSYVQALLREGVELILEHRAANVADPALELVVASTAIPSTNPELIAARERGIPVWPRARMLAWLGQGYEILAVAGTHGKTTTSSLLATALMELGADPSFLIGGVLNAYDTSAHVSERGSMGGFSGSSTGASAGDTTGDTGGGSSTGSSRRGFMVVEADESDASFVELDPHLAIITNIEADHMDHFESLEEIKQSFLAFLDKLDDQGIAIVCADSPGLRELAEQSGKPYLSYGTDAEAHVRLDTQSHEVCFADGERVPLVLEASPGVHNLLNATAALTALDWLGFDRGESAQALAAYAGAHRRFDRIGEAGGVVVVDDYAHHPTEIDATLKAAAGLGYSSVHLLFQPHRFTRTQAFLTEFATAFDDATTVTLLPVYAAGEAPIPGIDSHRMLRAIKQHAPAARLRLIEQRELVARAMATLAEPGSLIITMGAGDVTYLAAEILAELEAS